MAALAIVAAVLTVTSAMSAASAERQRGQQQKQALDFQAAQAEQGAGQSIAAAQRDSIEQQRQTRLVHSRALALAGASGAEVTDPSVVNLISNIDGMGSYRSSVALYQGEDKARQLRMQAAAGTYQGEVAVSEGKNQAAATMIGGFAKAAGGASTIAGSSMFSRFGNGGPSGDSGLLRAGNMDAAYGGGAG